jgi:probable rRNA maturation factor
MTRKNDILLQKSKKKSSNLVIQPSSYLNIQIASESPNYLKIKGIKANINNAINAAIEKLKISSKVSGAEISVYLCSDKTIQKINKETRGKNKPTNVLSFPFLDVDLRVEKMWKVLPETPVGEIICSLETCKREAKEQNKTLQNHIIHLFVHSTLHLFGYDHMHDAEANQMENLEIEILEKLGIDNPYLVDGF